MTTPDTSSTPQPEGSLAVLTRRQVSEQRLEVSTQPIEQLATNPEIFQPLQDNIFEMISKVHNSWRGHRGISSTVAELQKDGLKWRHMKKHVTQFISQCPTCQKQSVKKVAYNTIPFVTSSTKPHDRINVDTFQVSTDDAQGNKAVIVVVDTCTRWTELYPVPSWEQEFVGMSLLQHFGRYGSSHQ